MGRVVYVAKVIEVTQVIHGARDAFEHFRRYATDLLAIQCSVRIG